MTTQRYVAVEYSLGASLPLAKKQGGNKPSLVITELGQHINDHAAITAAISALNASYNINALIMASNNQCWTVFNETELTSLQAELQL